MKLRKKVQDNPAFDQQSSRLHCVLSKYCHPLKIDLLKLIQTELLARAHPLAKLLPQLEGPKHPSQYAISSTNAHNTYNIILWNPCLTTSLNI